jgi:hypothetical protein
MNALAAIYVVGRLTQEKRVTAKTNLTFVPAYGRQYVTVMEALDDWHAGKDFRAYPGGFYLSKRDSKTAPNLYKQGWLVLPNLKLRFQIW